MGGGDVEKHGEMTKRGRDTEMLGIKYESQKMSVYASYAAIIIK